jgi:hypothetical protein
MARSFDGSGSDTITFGSDASIDDFAAITIAFYSNWVNTGALKIVLDKSSATTTDGWVVQFRNTNVAALARDFSSARQTWAGDGTITGLRHIVISHDGNVANNPRIVVDGVAGTISSLESGSGTLDADAANTLLMGEATGGGVPYQGTMQAFTYHDAVFSAAEENRHRWWGMAPGGPSTMKVWHPFWTTATANKGTSTADATVTNTTMGSLPRGMRPGMGMS